MANPYRVTAFRDASHLEAVLNEQAAQGFRLHSVVAHLHQMPPANQRADEIDGYAVMVAVEETT